MFLKNLQNQISQQFYFWNNCKNIGFSNISFRRFRHRSRLQKYSQNLWFYNMFENNVVKTSGSTTFAKTMSLESLISATLFLESETNGSNNIVFINVVKPIVLVNLILRMLENEWF